MIEGIPIFTSSLAAKLVSGKPLAHKRWHWQRGYARRIEKKWAKRYGPVKFEPCMFKVLQGMIVHPDLMSKIKELVT